ncbi:MAG: hypothetical protein IJ733_03325 [Lachnospiraceae bacterium]|nr:hypothetical protein [Lachnospiraceae bacterium]
MKIIIKIISIFKGYIHIFDYVKNETEEKKTVEEVVEECKHDSDLCPTCNHDWRLTFHSDIRISEEQFFDLYEEHLFLAKITCRKCDTVAITKPIPVTEAMSYTNEDLTKTILYYLDHASLHRDMPKHKHQHIQVFVPIGHMWSIEEQCSICGTSFDS